MQGEKLSAESAEAERFVPIFQDFVRKEILSLHEISIWTKLDFVFCQIRPKQSSEKSASSWKKPKDRVTVAACCNATGTISCHYWS